MNKVFINDKPLFFSDSADERSSCKQIHYKTKQSIFEAVEYLEENECVYLIAENIAEAQKEFVSLFTEISAAGGLVKNNKNEVLFILRLNKWDLPKGKIEKGENPSEAALREVEEECGVKDLKITKQLPSTYHTYLLKGKKILKKTYWFEMIANGNTQLKPQIEEHITEVKWMNNEEIKIAMGNTYGSIKDVITAAKLF